MSHMAITEFFYSSLFENAKRSSIAPLTPGGRCHNYTSITTTIVKMIDTLQTVWVGGMVLFWVKAPCSSMQAVANEQGEHQ